MATSLAITLSAGITWTFTNALDLTTTSDGTTLDLGDTLANGTGVNQADVMWHDSRLLSATSEELDLAGSLTNAFGTTVTFAKIKTIIIKNTSTTTTQILAVGGAAATQFSNWVAHVSDIVNIGPDGVLILHSPIDGYAVGAGATDKLKIDAGAVNITYKIVLIGTSA